MKLGTKKKEIINNLSLELDSLEKENKSLEKENQDLKSTIFELKAELVYERFEYDGVDKKPKWVSGGNSIKQEEARDIVRNMLK